MNQTNKQTIAGRTPTERLISVNLVSCSISHSRIGSAVEEPAYLKLGYYHDEESETLRYLDDDLIVATQHDINTRATRYARWHHFQPCVHPSPSDPLAQHTSVNSRPAVVVADKVEAELSSTSSIIVMIDEHISIVISENSRVARSMDIAMASKKLGATALHHRFASLVNVRASDASRAANHSAVRAIDSLAAAVESGPEVEVVAVLGDVGRLDGTAVVGTSRDGDEFVCVDGLAS
jgi:hypothetical protein